METDIILALDLGRYNSVACWHDPRTRVVEFRSIQMTPEEVRSVLVREPVSSVVFEACSQAGWVHDLCEAAGLSARVASTTGSAWQWKHVKRKTDRDDALKLARLEAVGEIDPVSSAKC
jgi:transposase